MIQRDFLQTVVASGHVETPHRADIGVQITGVVVRIPVAEGQTVKAGDLLVELDAVELQANERQAALAMVQAQDRLRQLREVQAPVAEQNLRQAQVTLENARSTLRRNQDLFVKNFISDAALDDSRKAVDLADAQMRSAQNQFDTAGTQGSDTALAQASVAQTHASLQAARARTGYAQVRSPRDGTLIARNVEVGDVVQPGKVLMTLSPTGQTQLIVDIDEKNLHFLALGQKALASADAFAQQRFSAELTYINPGVNAQTGAVQVKLDVSAPPVNLRQDMTVSVDIEVARHAQALLLASSAVRDADSAAPWVFLVKDGRAQRHPLRLGLRSGGWAEVLEGLRVGDKVIDGVAAFESGERVHAIAHTE
ncbi:efflux RND transporter periplasmic adaptor subunit [Rhodoferax sp.]|uniref:efflux RND transporter periplasmic adaptor subunit n=1 Tax=Rhodoferax sp. TaxID=50421 RepID=UPI00285253E0|nr:efflux RND transporter periplasmic adaptor subunit [Rhodoferax sp.]